MKVPATSLRKPRPHYMTLPAQAIKCRLAHLKPAGSVSVSHPHLIPPPLSTFLLLYSLSILSFLFILFLLLPLSFLCLLLLHSLIFYFIGIILFLSCSLSASSFSTLSFSIFIVLFSFPPSRGGVGRHPASSFR